MVEIIWLKIFRVIIIGVGYFIICTKPESSTWFFKTLFIFSGGLLYDYISLAYVASSGKNKNDTNYNYQRILSTFGIVFSIVFFVLSIIGLSEVLQIGRASCWERV